MDGRLQNWGRTAALLFSITISVLHSETLIAESSRDYNLFGEIAGGYTRVIPDDHAETRKTGYHIIPSLFGEKGTENWMYQVGGGLFYDRLYASGEKTFAGPTNDTVKRQKNVRIETRAGEIELAARYRYRPELEFGLLGRALFGTSLSFSQDKDSKSTKFFIGPQAVLRLPDQESWLRRLDLSLLTDLNVRDRKVFLLTAGVAIGRTIVHDKPEEPAPAPQPAPAPENKIEEVFADKAINFASGSSVVQGPALGFLTELGAYLKDHPDLWEQIAVEGHTDKNGKLDYNMKLSKDRAEAVRQALIKQGVSADKIKSEGYGPTRPLVEEKNAETRAINRRVVMGFATKGHAERSQLGQTIKDLRKKYFNE